MSSEDRPQGNSPRKDGGQNRGNYGKGPKRPAGDGARGGHGQGGAKGGYRKRDDSRSGQQRDGGYRGGPRKDGERRGSQGRQPEGYRGKGAPRAEGYKGGGSSQRSGGSYRDGSAPHRDGKGYQGSDRGPRRDGFRDGGDRRGQGHLGGSPCRFDGSDKPKRSYGDDRRSFDKPKREGSFRKDVSFDGSRRPQPAKPPRPIAEGQENYYRGPEEPFRPGGANARPQQPRLTGKPPAARPPRNDGKASPRPVRHATPARRTALEALERIRTRDAFAEEVVDKVVDRAQLSPEDKAFATRLVLGVVSTSGVLDEMLYRCMRTPDDAQPDVMSALRISAYEILFLGKADYTAVDQGVELARDVAPRAGGLANAVLRRLATVAKAFPFGDPKTDDGAFAFQQGFPKWLLDEVQASIGREEGRLFVAASNQPAPIYVGVNALRATDEEMVALLTSAKGNPQPATSGGITPPACYLLETGRVLQDGRIARALNLGQLIVSDASAQAVATLCLPEEKPASFLEVGSGRATKTALIQSGAQRKYGSQIERYVAVDSFAFKGRILKERAETCGFNVSEMVVGDGRKLDELLGEELFDVVLLDAPCSGLGTLRRHQDIRWRIKPETIEEDAKLSAQLLQSAAAKVASGGLLVFSTCTVTRQENVEQVAHFLESEAGAAFVIEEVNGTGGFANELVPGGPDAHFAVKLRRKG